MDIAGFLFLILSVVAVAGGLTVVLTPNPVYSVLALVVTFFVIAGHYAFLLDAQFLAVVNVIVYAGAIMVLFLFVIMLLNLNQKIPFRHKPLVKVMGIVFGGLFVLSLFAAIISREPELIGPSKPFSADIGTVQVLGKTLFKEYILPFEVLAVLFLSAMIGAVMLGKKNLKEE